MQRIGRRFRPGLRRSLRFQMESGDFPVPVLYLKLGENSGVVAKDSSPEGNDGDIEGASWVTGFLGSGLSFDGLDDYVKVDDHASIDFTDVNSFLCVIKVLAYGATQVPRILHRAGDTVNLGVGSTAEAGGIPEGNIGLYTPDLGWRDMGKHLDLDTYYSIAFVFDGDKWHVYVDTVEEYTSGSTTIDISGDLYLGCTSALGEFLNVIIDEVRVYDVALTHRQVRELYYGIM